MRKLSKEERLLIRIETIKKQRELETRRKEREDKLLAQEKELLKVVENKINDSNESEGE